MDLGVKRVLLVIASIILGIAGTFGVVGFMKLAYDPYITMQSYGSTYAVLTGVPLALLAGVLLDFFMKTGLLPEGE